MGDIVKLDVEQRPFLDAAGGEPPDMDQRLRNLETDVAVIKSNYATKEDVTGLKVDFAGLRVDFAELKGEFGGLKGEFGGLKGEFQGLKEEMASQRRTIEWLKYVVLIATGIFLAVGYFFDKRFDQILDLLSKGAGGP